MTAPGRPLLEQAARTALTVVLLIPAVLVLIAVFSSHP